MLRKALSLKRFPYKSGCACSEKWGRPSTFALLFTRLGGHAPKSWTAAGLARAFFIRFYRFLGGYTPKKHWIFSRETGWSCSEFCSYVPHLLLLFQGGFAISLDSNWIVWACFYPEKPVILAQKKHRNYPVLKS